jgi:general secretion pathway protein E
MAPTVINTLLKILERDTTIPGPALKKIRAGYERNRAELMAVVLGTRQVEERQLLNALGQLYKMPVLSQLDIETLSSSWTGHVPRAFLKTHCTVPLIPVKGQDKAVIAVNDPGFLSGADDLAALIPLETYDLALAPKSAILAAINHFYDPSGDSASQLVEDMEGREYVIDDSGQAADLLDDASDAPVIRLVNQMISQAVKARASDIHIEPFQDTLTIRYRIDGILYERLTPPKGIQASLISRIKVMANMNIAEKRVPQDGRAQVRMGDQEIDIRVSTIPTGFGERLVMRLLNKSGQVLSFGDFGLSDRTVDHISRIIRQSNGIVLVTGPTGSGKTTTLYACLSDINSPDKNIITIEDPVEYNLPGIGQIQVNPKTGVTFARGLRSIVRQDPDVVLVGEIRDGETAGIAIQSALTGHLVFSTLHTNDAASAVTRLVDLGVEPYLISSSLNAVIAQRLVRVLCPHCKTPVPPEAAALKLESTDLAGQTIFAPRGCAQCFDTGYSGRQAIFEILDLTTALKSLISTTSETNEIKAMAVSKGMTTLRQDGMTKVMQGITSIEEVLRVTQA